MPVGARVIVRMVLVLVAFGLMTSNALACVCVAQPLEKRLRTASAVFVGQAAFDLPSQDPSAVQGQGGQTLSVLKAWKGVTREICLDKFRRKIGKSGAYCPTLYFFEEGQKYLVFAYGKELRVKTVCSDTWKIPDDPSSPGYEQMREFTRRLDSFWFRLGSLLRP